MRIGRLGAMRGAAVRDDGFSLLEVLVSFLLFVIVSASATAAIVSAIRASHRSQQRVEGTGVAQAVISRYMSSPGSAVLGTKTYLLSVKNEQFSVTQTIAFTDPRATQCLGGASHTYLLNVSVSQAQTKQFLVRNDALIAC
jgi:type II secretory pathway pseudopilin PulG